MKILIINRTLNDAYVAMTKDLNKLPLGEERTRLEGCLEGFKQACRILEVDYSVALMEADAEAMEQYGEVPMCGGVLIDVPSI